MSNLQDIKLVPRNRDKGSFVNGGMTIQLGGNGNPELIESNLALDQDIMKAIFTGTQPDGYGTVIQQVIGDKNTGVVRAMLTFTIISTMQALIRAHEALARRFPTQFRLGRLIESIDFIKIKDANVDSVTVQMNFRTKALNYSDLTVKLNSTKD